MPKVLPEYLEHRREQILDASAACFARRGFHATTMQDICKEAELSPGAVYRYFPSKDSIIQAMCERGGNQNAGAIREALERGSTQEVLSGLIQTFFLDLDDLHGQADCALNVELIAEAPRSEHIREWLTRNLSEARELFNGLISRAQQNGEIDAALDPDSVGQVMIALYYGYITQKLVDPKIDAAAYAAVANALFKGTFWQAKSAPPSSAASAMHH